jgi:copper chaperone CopZ
MRQLRLSIGSMGCRHCVREVTAWLRDVPGVATVVADATTCTVELGGTMDAADVLAVFAGSRYAARLLDGHSAAPPADRSGPRATC